MYTDPNTKYIDWSDGTVQCRECGELFDTSAAFDAHTVNGAGTGQCLATYQYPSTLKNDRTNGHWKL